MPSRNTGRVERKSLYGEYLRAVLAQPAENCLTFPLTHEQSATVAVRTLTQPLPMNPNTVHDQTPKPLSMAGLGDVARPNYELVQFSTVGERKYDVSVLCDLRHFNLAVMEAARNAFAAGAEGYSTLLALRAAAFAALDRLVEAPAGCRFAVAHQPEFLAQLRVEHFYRPALAAMPDASAALTERVECWKSQRSSVGGWNAVQLEDDTLLQRTVKLHGKNKTWASAFDTEITPTGAPTAACEDGAAPSLCDAPSDAELLLSSSSAQPDDGCGDLEEYGDEEDGARAGFQGQRLPPQPAAQQPGSATAATEIEIATPSNWAGPPMPLFTYEPEGWLIDDFEQCLGAPSCANAAVPQPALPAEPQQVAVEPVVEIYVVKKPRPNKLAQQPPPQQQIVAAATH